MPQSHLQTDILYIKCTNTKLVVTHVCVLSCVRLFVTPWTVIPPSMGFSRQEYWSGLPFPIPGDFLEPGIEPMSPVSPALAGGFVATEHQGSGHICSVMKAQMPRKSVLLLLLTTVHFGQTPLLF